MRRHPNESLHVHRDAEPGVTLRGTLQQAMAAVRRAGGTGIDDVTLADAIHVSVPAANSILSDLSHRGLVRKAANQPNAGEHPKWVKVGG